MEAIKELSQEELVSIDGGDNLLEYIAYGVGWLVGAVVGGAETLGEMGDGVRFSAH